MNNRFTVLCWILATCSLMAGAIAYISMPYEYQFAHAKEPMIFGNTGWRAMTGAEKADPPAGSRTLEPGENLILDPAKGWRELTEAEKANPPRALYIVDYFYAGLVGAALVVGFWLLIQLLRWLFTGKPIGREGDQ